MIVVVAASETLTWSQAVAIAVCGAALIACLALSHLTRRLLREGYLPASWRTGAVCASSVPGGPGHVVTPTALPFLGDAQPALLEAAAAAARGLAGAMTAEAPGPNTRALSAPAASTSPATLPPPPPPPRAERAPLPLGAHSPDKQRQRRRHAPPSPASAVAASQESTGGVPWAVAELRSVIRMHTVAGMAPTATPDPRIAVDVMGEQRAVLLAVTSPTSASLDRLTAVLYCFLAFTVRPDTPSSGYNTTLHLAVN